MTYKEILDKFTDSFPFVKIENYRPICHELFEKNKEGCTIWLDNGDMIVYYLNQVIQMTKQEAIDLLDNLIGMIEDNHGSDYDSAIRMAIDALKPQWIPCSERLPYAEYGESDNVLATCGHRDVEDGSFRWIKTLYFNGGNWCYPAGETYLEKVYAWMPLPEPYKEGNDEVN